MTTRKSYSGGAVPTSISSGAFGVGATTLTLTVATGWPTTTNGPFVATIDRGLATQEKILIATRTGVTCSSITRGYDLTSEVGHGSNASIEHCLDANTLDEANRLSSLLTTKGDDLGHDGTQVQRLAVGAAGTYLTATPAAATGKSWTAPTPPVVTTKGDLETFSTVPARLAVGANFTVLSANSVAATGLQWRQLVYSQWRRTTAQSMTGSSYTTISWDTEDADPGGMATVPFSGVQLGAGLWVVSLRTTFANLMPAGSSLAIINSAAPDAHGFYQPTTGSAIDTSMCALIFSTTTWVVNCQVGNNAAPAINLNAATLVVAQLLGA